MQSTWKPIPLSELYDDILETEKDLRGELSNFWELIQIFPEKWEENEYGKEGGGFWVVAICGKRIIWYNDIEEGFNISNYNTYGKFDDYHCNQDELEWCIVRLFDLIKFGGDVLGQASGPLPI